MNTPAKRTAVRQVAEALQISILGLQETKLETWQQHTVRELGGNMLNDYAVLPAMCTRGGAAILWNKNVVTIATHAIGKFAITAKVTLVCSPSSLWLTTVYGPADDASKDDFLSELARTAPHAAEPCLINGDFNLIYEARDKNNHNLNRRLMGRFRTASDGAGLRQIKCSNHRITWSNERDTPTLASIDKFFCNTT